MVVSAISRNLIRFISPHMVLVAKKPMSQHQLKLNTIPIIFQIQIQIQMLYFGKIKLIRDVSMMIMMVIVMNYM